jgi:hypothetical protein
MDAELLAAFCRSARMALARSLSLMDPLARICATLLSALRPTLDAQLLRRSISGDCANSCERDALGAVITVRFGLEDFCSDADSFAFLTPIMPLKRPVVRTVMPITPNPSGRDRPMNVPAVMAVNAMLTAEKIPSMRELLTAPERKLLRNLPTVEGVSLSAGVFTDVFIVLFYQNKRLEV